MGVARTRATPLDGVAIGRLAWVAIAAGALLRIWHFAGGRSLWLDEAMIALNIRHLSVRELFGALYYDQVAPIGWLLAEKVLDGTGVQPEFALRVIALLASLGSMLLFRRLAFRVLGGGGALAAVVLFAFAPQLIRYAAEVKPYALDAFFAVAILLVGVELVSRRAYSWRRLGGISALGLLAIPFSFPVVFVLAAVGLTAMARRLSMGRIADAAAVALVSAVWLALFVALHLSVYKVQTAGTMLNSGGSFQYFVQYAYAPLPPRTPRDVAWFGAWGREAVLFFFRGDSRLAAGLMMVFGACAVWRRSPWIACLLAASVPIALLASGFHAYPLYGRLMLFTAPAVILVTAAGIQWLSGSGRRGVAVWLVLMILVMWGGVLTLKRELTARPAFAREHVRPVLKALGREFRPGDVVYVGRRWIAAYMYYKADFGLETARWTPGLTASSRLACVISDLPDAPAKSRIWVLIYSNVKQSEAPEIAALLAARGSGGTVERTAQRTKIVLYSVRLNAPLSGHGMAGLSRWPSNCEPPSDRLSDPQPSLRRRVDQPGP